MILNVRFVSMANKFTEFSTDMRTLPRIGESIVLFQDIPRTVIDIQHSFMVGNRHIEDITIFVG